MWQRTAYSTTIQYQNLYISVGDVLSEAADTCSLTACHTSMICVFKVSREERSREIRSESFSRPKSARNTRGVATTQYSTDRQTHHALEVLLTLCSVAVYFVYHTLERLRSVLCSGEKSTQRREWQLCCREFVLLVRLTDFAPSGSSAPFPRPFVQEPAESKRSKFDPVVHWIIRLLLHYRHGHGCTRSVALHKHYVNGVYHITRRGSKSDGRKWTERLSQAVLSGRSPEAHHAIP